MAFTLRMFRAMHMPPLVASGVPPDVEGGILPPGKDATNWQ